MTNEKAIMCLEDMKIKVPIPKAAKQARENNEALDVAIKALQSAEPKRIRGKWIYCEDSIVDCVDGYRCDQCGFFVPWDYKHKGIDFIQDYNFCPNCGADMREKGENHESN